MLSSRGLLYVAMLATVFKGVPYSSSSSSSIQLRKHTLTSYL